MRRTSLLRDTTGGLGPHITQWNEERDTDSAPRAKGTQFALFRPPEAFASFEHNETTVHDLRDIERFMSSLGERMDAVMAGRAELLADGELGADGEPRPRVPSAEEAMMRSSRGGAHTTGGRSVRFGESTRASRSRKGVMSSGLPLQGRPLREREKEELAGGGLFPVDDDLARAKQSAMVEGYLKEFKYRKRLIHRCRKTVSYTHLTLPTKA